jgi:hypothetical protein
VGATILVELTPLERELILRYGYPLEQIKRAVSAVSPSDGIQAIPLSKFELGRLIADLLHNTTQVTDPLIGEQLADLCERLDYAEFRGDGTLGIL